MLPEDLSSMRSERDLSRDDSWEDGDMFGYLRDTKVRRLSSTQRRSDTLMEQVPLSSTRTPEARSHHSALVAHLSHRQDTGKVQGLQGIKGLGGGGGWGKRGGGGAPGGKGKP